MSLAGYPKVESCGFNGSEDSSILFARSVENATKYPTNLVYPHGYDYQLEECRKRLDENEASLFGDENVVDILEINEEEIDFSKKRLKDDSDLNDIGIRRELSRNDPRCRFVFVSAPNSRDRLSIKRHTLLRILTWHQVMPEFIDFMLAFGVSEYPKDFLYSGFRSEVNLSNDCNRLILPGLGRSGREIRMCHALRSVEQLGPTKGLQQDWPWAMRPTVTYHSFDAESGKSVWVVVKANGLIIVSNTDLPGKVAS